MENEGDGWSSRGSDPGPAGPGDADSEVGGWVASEEREVRKRRRKKGGEGRSSPETGDGGRTAAGDGGIQSRPFGRHQSGHGWSTNEDLTTRYCLLDNGTENIIPNSIGNIEKLRKLLLCLS
ncbi:hypothetical protein TRIUR3_28832 [Triticum urartu]|uniref:Uncharacterized protein n=1 Tax=Triticum urartu TaxID=4572 RepID=M7ZHI2_TRIUA|nr:hypothetical protein TRIUR3_28832 [Triticum urartu]